MKYNSRLLVRESDFSDCGGGEFIIYGEALGQMFLRGEIEQRRFGKEVKIGKVAREDTKLLKKHVGDFCTYFGFDQEKILKEAFTKIYPYTHRPYGTIYAY